MTLPKIVVVEDSRFDQFCVKELVGEQFDLTFTRTLAAGLEVIRTGIFAGAVLDLNVLDAEGVQIVTTVRAAAPTLPIVVLTGNKDAEAEAIKAGADEFVVKGNASHESLERALCHALKKGRQ